MRIAILGLGLVGGSLALALKKFGDAEDSIVGHSQHERTIEKARKRGMIDTYAMDLPSAVSGADVTVIATPILAARSLMQEIAPYLKPGSLVTDTGSTKALIMQWAREYLPGNVNFIGGHPMAGKETSGIDEADAELFRKCTYCLIPSQEASPESVETVQRLVTNIGGKPLFLDAEVHDNLVAGVSHLPMLLSVAFVLATVKSDHWPDMSKVTAGGYRDVSRLASGNAYMNRDICLTNRSKILAWIDRYLDELRELRRLVEEGNEGIIDILEQARQARTRWLEGQAL